MSRNVYVKDLLNPLIRKIYLNTLFDVLLVVEVHFQKILTDKDNFSNAQIIVLVLHIMVLQIIQMLNMCPQFEFWYVTLF